MIKKFKEWGAWREKHNIKYTSINAILSGVLIWVRIPYNMLMGLSFMECLEYEFTTDYENLGLRYKGV